jgi:hypothetical protein
MTLALLERQLTRAQHNVEHAEQLGNDAQRLEWVQVATELRHAITDLAREFNS